MKEGLQGLWPIRLAESEEGVSPVKYLCLRQARTSETSQKPIMF